MAKLTLADVTNILGNPTSAANTINSNNTLIETALENTLSRDGTTPNQMNADIDMDNNDLLNVGTLDTDTLLIGGNVVVPGEVASSQIASQAEAEAGINNTKIMTPLRTKQSISSEVGVSIASATQGLKADSAVQPVINRGAMKIIDFTKTLSVNLREQGREGLFSWISGDQSAFVSADTGEGLYVAPSSDPTGVSGAWVRDQGWRVSGVNIGWFGAVGDGVVNDTTAIQRALSVANILGIKRVYGGGGGTYLYNAALTIPANVSFEGDFQTTLKQLNSANLAEQILMSNNSRLFNWIVDGNRANNTDNIAFVGVRIGNNNDCVVERNIIKNMSGYCVVTNNGVRSKIRQNTFFNFYQFGYAAFGNNSHCDHEVYKNIMHTIGWGGLAIQNVDYAEINSNIITGQIIGGRDGALSVNTSGTTVTWVSGPTFTNVLKGNFVVLNTGAEFRVSSVNSSTSITVETALPALAGTPASIGSGDLIGITASNFCQIHDNFLSRTSTFLFGYSLGATAVQSGNGSFHNNILEFAGKNAINLNGTGSSFIENVSLINNKISNAGYGGGIGTTDRVAIFLASVAPTKIGRVHIADNTVISFAGAGQTTYWLGTDGQMSVGAISVGKNRALDLANNGIFNDVSTITLSPGWGSTATTSAITSHGNSVIFTITCSGAGFANSPSFTVNKCVGSGDVPPLIIGKVVNVSGGAGLFDIFGEQLSSVGAWAGILNGTPANGHVYTIIVKGA